MYIKNYENKPFICIIYEGNYYEASINEVGDRKRFLKESKNYHIQKEITGKKTVCKSELNPLYRRVSSSAFYRIISLDYNSISKKKR